MNVEMAVHALAVSTDGGPCAIVLRGVRLPVMLPIGSQANFKGVVNALTKKAYLGEGRARAPSRWPA